MYLRLVREPSRDGSTHGSLYAAGHWLCWTLEDQIREVEGMAVASWKVPAQTAIPAGIYPMRVTRSQRFQRNLPLVMDVPGFSGIRIHAGNTIADTEGCILVGLDRQHGRVLRSRVALERVMETLGDGSHMLTVENPPQALGTVLA